MLTKDHIAASIQMHSGRFFNFLQPWKNEFSIQEIAHSLSNLCRFTGHCKKFYSVAQHSVLVSWTVEPEFAYDALMHDAHEAFIGDMASPLKALIPEYREIENRVQAAVRARFGVSDPLPDDVKHADLVLLATEQRDLMAPPAHLWQGTAGIVPLDIAIVPMPPAEACSMFIDRYHYLRRFK